MPITNNANGPVRIAIISSSLALRGAEKQTVYLTRALVQAGASVRFYYLGEGGHYEAILRQIVPLSQIYRRHQPWFILTRLCKALWSFCPHIVFSPQFGDLLQGGLAGRLCHALTLGGIRSDGLYELNAHGRRSIWMLRLAHGLLANSHHARRNLASHAADGSRIKILPNVIGLREFDIQSSRGAPFEVASDRVMALAVGGLEPGKRFDRFLNALALARRKAPALFGVIAGPDCGSRRALEQQARELGIFPDHVVFTGECENIPSLLTQAGFLLLCSDCEGFPNVILEAMAASLPVITTPVGDAGRIVVEHRTGFVVNADRIDAMAERMVELALSSTLRARLGAEGRSRVAEEYDYELLPLRLIGLLRDFAAENGRCWLANRLQPGRSVTDASLPSEALLFGKSAA